ncbi:MAG: hypothetical protein U0457_17480 [Candidatus Sericytochromatia bacterium]
MLEEYIQEKLPIIKESILEFCSKCNSGIENCNYCPINESYSELNIEKEHINLNIINYIENITYEKNTILLTQNTLEEICFNCSFIGEHCFTCKLHKFKRNLASLPIFEIKNKVIYSNKESTSSCGSSCKTSCSKK